MPAKKRERWDSPWMYLVAFAVLAVGIVCFIGWSWEQTESWFGKPDAPGVFGDMFGGVNALFSGLAFAGVILTLVLQSRELQLQREEMADTREVLGDQKAQLEAQSETLQRQAFETTFFNMLKLHEDTIRSLSTGKGPGAVTFQEMMGDVANNFQSQGGSAWSAVLRSRSFLRPYFRQIENIVQFVDKSPVGDSGFYVGLLIDRLSLEEAWALLFHCRFGGAAQLQALVEKYGMLRNLEKKGGFPKINQLSEGIERRAFETSD
ncbi:MAG: hypothetical protein A49_11740 [Methyloceanibacter sp.]|nr:MAG: hypothetical protein A49_11740 [Methyloceanibacter sp.]